MKTGWIFTEQTLEMLAKLKEEGKTFNQAAKAIHSRTDTIRDKAEKFGFSEELAEIYPPIRASIADKMSEMHMEFLGMRKLKPEQIAVPLEINWDSPYVRSAVRPWRATA